MVLCRHKGTHKVGCEGIFVIIERYRVISGQGYSYVYM